MDPTVLLLLVAIAAVGIMVFLAIALTGKRTYSFDKEEYQVAFLAIENKLQRDNPSSFNLSVINADKLLDKAMMEMGVPGKTMGDRLKHSSTKFSQLNAVWYAHKLRNRLAHESGFDLEYSQAAHALVTYKQALKDLGAI